MIYSLRISVSSFMFCGNFTQSLNISGLFSAPTTSFMQRDTEGCDKAVNLLLPIGD